MNDSAHSQAKRELESKTFDQGLYDQCLKQAEGNEKRAHAYYVHRRAGEIAPKSEDLDQREKWPMLTPLLILYTLGTIGVLALVYGFLANRLGWW
jgi:hypothetical protein